MLYIDRWKLIVIALICLLGFVYASPNVFLSREAADESGDVPFYVPYRSVNLGLDLRGGSYLLLKVEADVVVQERIDSLQDVVRSALREARVRRRNMQVEGAADIQVVQPLAGTVLLAGQNFKRFFAVGIANGHQALAVVQPLQTPR